MKITKDFQADAAYIYILPDIKGVQVDYTIPIIDERTWGMINIDIVNWKIFGIEVIPLSLIDNSLSFEKIG